MSRTHQQNDVVEGAPCAHRLHLSITQSICNCADCGEILPVFALRLKTSEDLIVQAQKQGILVTWPCIAGTAVADA